MEGHLCLGSKEFWVKFGNNSLVISEHRTSNKKFSIPFGSVLSISIDPAKEQTFIIKLRHHIRDRLVFPFTSKSKGGLFAYDCSLTDDFDRWTSTLIPSWSKHVEKRAPVLISRDNLLSIFSQLSHIDLCSSALVCTTFRDVAQDNDLWKKLCLKHARISLLFAKNNKQALSTTFGDNVKDWKQEFIKLYFSPSFVPYQVYNCLTGVPDSYTPQQLAKIVKLCKKLDDSPLVKLREFKVPEYRISEYALNDRFMYYFAHFFVYIHGIPDGKILHKIPITYECKVGSVTMSKSGDFAASGGMAGIASVYSLRVHKKFPHAGWVSTKFCDNKLVTCCGDEYVRCVDLEVKEEILKVPVPQPDFDFDIFEQLVGVTSDQYIAFLDLRLGVAAITFETDEKFIKFHPSGVLFATDSSLYDIRNLKQPVRDYNADEIQFSPSGLHMFQRKKNIVSVYDVTTGDRKWEMKGKYHSIHIAGNSLLCNFQETVQIFGCK